LVCKNFTFVSNLLLFPFPFTTISIIKYNKRKKQREPEPHKKSAAPQYLYIYCSLLYFTLIIFAFLVICGLGIDRAPYEDDHLPPPNSTVDQAEQMYTKVDETLFYVLISLSVLLAVLFTSNFYLIGHVVQALLFSQRRHLQRSIANQVRPKCYLQAFSRRETHPTST
jgi:amino acid transporter